MQIEGGLLIGWLVTLPSFGVLVQVLGTRRAARYVPWFLFGVAAFYCLLRYDVFELQLVGIVAVVTAVGMHYMFYGSARYSGLRLYRRQTGELSETKSKITIGDLLVATAAIAAVAAVASVYHPPDASLISIEQIVFLLFYGVGVTAIQLSCVWLVFGRHQFWFRFLFVVTSIAAVTCSALIETGLMLGKPIPWQVSSWSVAAALAVGSLLILRSHGYRIDPVHSVQKTK